MNKWSQLVELDEVEIDYYYELKGHFFGFATPPVWQHEDSTQAARSERVSKDMANFRDYMNMQVPKPPTSKRKPENAATGVSNRSRGGTKKISDRAGASPIPDSGTSPAFELQILAKVLLQLLLPRKSPLLGWRTSMFPTREFSSLTLLAILGLQLVW
ncbi:uncharacterized protein LOC119999338 [Tripterygium wilfordii]|uniref:uncharacterized protein LOC119999338 n=1 Tax=Tripterygium wilfordii TaxID=458696 RepID=UPI0018F80050|nr:uncharacterized protein LOC119999338 [Tripterygium wilfordii]